ncbi:MAG: acyl-ACP thioesterase domain-containing protein, partial [Bacteroidota bacterium]
MSDRSIWQESFYIPSYFVGPDLRAHFPAICYCLQEAAGNHASQHGMGYFDMQAQQQFWVLNRLRVVMQRWPQWRETMQLKTWVSNMKGPFSYRQFELTDAQGQLLGSASTLWVLLDAVNRKPVRFDAAHFPIDTRVADCGLPDKVARVAPPASFPGPTAFHQVLPSDLDMIDHVNNV